MGVHSYAHCHARVQASAERAMPKLCPRNAALHRAQAEAISPRARRAARPRLPMLPHTLARGWMRAWPASAAHARLPRCTRTGRSEAADAGRRAPRRSEAASKGDGGAERITTGRMGGWWRRRGRGWLGGRERLCACQAARAGRLHGGCNSRSPRQQHSCAASPLATDSPARSDRGFHPSHPCHWVRSRLAMAGDKKKAIGETQQTHSRAHSRRTSHVSSILHG